MNFMKEPVSLFPIRPVRSIGEIRGFIPINENATDKVVVTKHPTQTGASISDHKYKEPSDVSISILVNDNEKPLEEMYNIFLEMQESSEPFNLVTGKRAYSNMVIVSIGQTTDKSSENILSLNLTFQEVLIVSVTTSNVPERKKQANAGVTGATEKAPRKSALKILGGGIADLVGGL